MTPGVEGVKFGDMPAPRQTFFGSQLDRLLREKGLSVRGLARRMAKGDPDKEEQYRRSLRKWRRGDHDPAPQSRNLVAEGLDVPSETFDEPETPDVKATRLQRCFESTSLTGLVNDLTKTLRRVTA